MVPEVLALEQPRSPQRPRNAATPTPPLRDRPRRPSVARLSVWSLLTQQPRNSRPHRSAPHPTTTHYLEPMHVDFTPRQARASASRWEYGVVDKETGKYVEVADEILSIGAGIPRPNTPRPSTNCSTTASRSSPASARPLMRLSRT